MPSTILQPRSLKELWRALPSVGASRKYLAGGTDLVARSGAGGRELWVDISGVRELLGIKETTASVIIGAGVKIAELGRSEAVRRWLPALHAAVPHFASPPIRNMATVGGNAANASPCADAVCALCAEGARIRLELKGARRQLPLPEFFRGPGKTALRKDELITAFEIPKRPRRGAYLKLGPRAYFGISKAAVGVVLELDGAVIRSASIALASVAPVSLPAVRTSAYLKGRALNAENARTAAALVKTEVSPITDLRSEAEYRREMCGVLLERALNGMKR